ncbi:hypothetical protein EV646_11817 [Kribbella antiqua]|uniref:Uncharacterized protein n=1 Tax=Kribbella antiqua TaxID=2512217 RepID=A0A4R2I714_9ACTN|nr:hypothetical protein [Kribbella antiqua]TCO40103.1 hypothetical protein EV646_11817 [Kribbella antiqua]
MDLETFRKQFQARRWLLIDQVVDVLVEAQEDVYGLISELADQNDKRAATVMVEEMADVLPPFLEGRSRARRLAEQALQKWCEGARGRDEKLAALAQARATIWQLADEAGDEEVSIRAMTRSLDCEERELEYGGAPWSEEIAERYQPTVQERNEQELWRTAGV